MITVMNGITNIAIPAMFNTIFAGVKTYTIEENAVSYGTMALIVCLLLGTLACLLTYLAQKKRSAV